MRYILSLIVLLFAGSTQAGLIFTYAGNGALGGGGQHNADTSAGSITDAQIEAFLGLASGSLDSLSPSGNNATEGSAIKASVNVEAGDTLSFDWMFSTDEDPNDPVCAASVCRDFAFYSAVLTTADGLFLLADALVDNAGSNGSLNFVASGTGALEIGIGVMDANDTLIGSFITASNFVFTDINPPVTGVPAPATLALFGLGFAGLGWSRRKKA